MLRSQIATGTGLFLLAAAALAATSVPDLRLVPGQPAQGEIAFDGEEDRVAVQLLAGTKLSFTAKTSKASALRPAVALYDASGAAQNVDSLHVTKTTSDSINGWLAPSTATYLLGIHGTPAGATGLYDLTTKATLPKAPAPVSGSIDAAAEVDAFDFDAAAGSKATLTLKRAKGSLVVARVQSVTAPDGTAISLAGVSRKSTDSLDQIKSLVLPQFGTYVVRVQGNGGSTGAYTLAFAAKAPAAPKTKLDFRGASGGEATAGAVTSIEIAPNSVAPAVGKTAPLVAKTTYADGRVRDGSRVVTWATRDPSVATVANGVVTGIAAGGTTIQAWSGAVEARESLVLVGGATVTDVTVLPSSSVVAPGDAITLGASATISVGSPVDVTSAADWSAPSGVPVTVAGSRITAGSTSGTAHVVASAGGVSGAGRDVTVSAKRVDRIFVSPAYFEIASGTKSFTATAVYSDGTTGDVTATAAWASDNLAAATMSGATATFVAAGVAGIRATLDGVTSREAVLNCGPVAISSIDVVGASSVPVGGTYAFAAYGNFADGGRRDVTEGATWTSGAPTFLGVSNTPGKRGRVTGLADSSPVTVTAAIGVRSGGAASSVGGSDHKSLFIVPRIGRVSVGASVPFHAYFRGSNGALDDVTQQATWTTSNAAAASVAPGVVTGNADGGAVISASLEGVTAHAVALSGVGRLTGVVVAPPSSNPLGGSTAASATATFSPSVGGDPVATITSAVSWSSADPVSLPIDATGVVSARRLGTAGLVATFGGIASSAQNVSSSAAVELSLAIFPQSPRAPANVNVQLAAQTTSSDGSVADRASTTTWGSVTTANATINTTGLVHAVAKGTSQITASRAGGLSDARTFTTTSDPPTISSVVAGSLLRGTTGNVVTINGTNLDGTNLSVTFSGTGVAADAAPTPNGAGTQATVPVSVAAGAATGQRDLTYTTISGGATKTNAVTVASAPPTITSISPTNIDVPASGSTQTTLTVTGGGFGAADTFVIGSTSGVGLSNGQVVNQTTMTGTVTVQAGATKARLDVTVQQSAAAGGQTATLTGALKIGAADPTLTSFTPALVTPPGTGTQHVAAAIYGTNFNSGIAASISGSSVSNVSFTRQSATLITGTFDVASTASFGAFDLSLTNAGDLVRTFTGVLVIAPRDPTVTAFSAPSVARGSSLAVEIDGTNFRTGDVPSATGGGVTFSNVTIATSERMTATMSVSASATISLRDLSVAHASSIGGRSGTLANAFRVTAAGPTVTSLNPSRVGRTGASGPTRRVPLVLTGTGFGVGASVAITTTGGSGITVVSNSVVVLSDTRIAFSVDVAGSATVAAWDVKVTNPSSLGDSGTTGNGKFTVSSETTLTVNNVVASTGVAAGGDRVTVYGAGFSRGLVVDFGTERAWNAQFIDQNTAVCVVPPPANPANASSTSNSTTATTIVDVKVTNPGGANATLTGGFGYLANQTPFKILASVPADSSTNQPQNLKSAVVRLSDWANTSSAVFGTTQGTNCEWFEAGAQRPTGMTGGFGADRRFLVFSRTGGGNLPINTTGKYVLETPTAVKSAAGAALVPAKLSQTLTYDQWVFFISSSVTDSTAPTLSTISPANSATNVPTNTSVSLTFSEAIDPLTVTASTITLTPQGGSPVACATQLSSDITGVTLTPLAELATNTTYTVAISGVADLCGNAFSSSTRTFTTGSGTDSTPPTVDSVSFEQIPSNMDGSTTYVAGTDTPSSPGSATAFRLYMPRSGWTVKVAFSDTGGAGIDETTFSAKASVAVGSLSANAELASKFAVTSTGASWTVAASDQLAAGDNATLTFTVKDKSGNTSTQKVVAVDVVDIAANAVGVNGFSSGGDMNPFDSRQTWVLRFDRDVYTASLSTSGSTQQVTTTASSNGVLDIEEALRIPGLTTANMTTDAANTVNGPSVGTNAIVTRLVEERIRATLRTRYGLAEDGTHGADAADIEFLLPGEQGSLSSTPTWSTASSSSSGHAYSEMDIGGDTGPNSSPTGTYTTIGLSFIDARNRNQEADINDGQPAGNNVGIFAINIAKGVMNSSVTGTTYGAKVLAKFQTAKGGTPIGEGSLDDDVLAGTYDRTSSASSNTQQMKDRYDAIMDAVEFTALSISGVAAHEMGHAMGLVPDSFRMTGNTSPTDGLGGPKRGFFGNAYNSNSFTEATASFPNTPGHLNYLGNDVMSPATTVDQRAATGTDAIRFSPFDRNYFLRRQVYDEGR